MANRVLLTITALALATACTDDDPTETPQPTDEELVDATCQLVSDGFGPAGTTDIDVEVFADGLEVPWPDNPAGLGFVMREEEVEGARLPLFEDPQHPITHWEDRPPTVGFGFCPITSGARMKSTSPVPTAETGMPSYRAVSGSCTTQRPPCSLIARRPLVPSAPVPERMTLAAFSAWSSAKLSRKSSIGRRSPRGCSNSLNSSRPSLIFSSRPGGMM